MLEFSLDLRGLGQRSSIIGSGAGFFSTVTTSGTPLDVTEGSASYFDVVTADGVIRDAAWTYEEPYDAVLPIAGHLAFYPDRVDIAVNPAS